MKTKAFNGGDSGGAWGLIGGAFPPSFPFTKNANPLLTIISTLPLQSRAPDTFFPTHAAAQAADPHPLHTPRQPRQLPHTASAPLPVSHPHPTRALSGLEQGLFRAGLGLVCDASQGIF